MSFLLAGLIVAGTSGGLAVGRWLSRRRAAADATQPPAAPADGAAKNDDEKDKDQAGGPPSVVPALVTSAANAASNAAAAAKKAVKKATKPTASGPSTHLEGFPCQLGDVLMRITGEEAWLAGGLVLSEEGPVSALFVAPEAVHDVAIYARPKPREAIYWMQPLDPGAVLVGGEPPSSVEHDGIRFDRVRRLPLRPKRIGVGAPDVGDAVVLAEYASAGSERLLVMRSTSGTSHAYRGEELEPSTFEVIASGKSTLGDD